jgi:hypothetical protein
MNADATDERGYLAIGQGSLGWTGPLISEATDRKTQVCLAS